MKRLIAIQQALRAPKDKRNSFGGFNYRSCESILEAVKPILKEQNCAILLSDELVQIGDRFYVKATAFLIGDDGQTINDVSAFAREEDSKKGMDASQVTGAASSYARKYALNGLLAIDDNKDADTDEYQRQTRGQQNTASNAPKQSRQAITQPQPQKPVKTQEKAQKTVDMSDLSAQDIEQCLELFNDMQDAENYEQLNASVELAKGKPYEKRVRDRANEIFNEKHFTK